MRLSPNAIRVISYSSKAGSEGNTSEVGASSKDSAAYGSGEEFGSNISTAIGAVP